MLHIYGNLLPLRMLEEIWHWKHLESRHVQTVISAVPELEPAYVHHLQDWDHVFERTRYKAGELFNQLWEEQLEAEEQHALELGEELEQLLAAARRQSEEFVHHLSLLETRSRSLRHYPSAPDVLRHATEDSRYFLSSTLPFQHEGAILRIFEYRANNPQGERPVPIGGHTLPPLPYPYNALEPYIDEKTMRIHHDKHHQSYVDGLNTAEKKLEEARKTGNFDLVKHWERELAFNGAGHYLHTIFWTIMNPKGGGKPEGTLAEQIKQDFGSYEAFKQQFSQAAEKVEGGGWAILVWSPRAGRLEILQAEKHQNLSQWDVVPLLPLDVWEHAYYLKHQNERKKYIEDWWNVVYWPAVQERYNKASKLRWTPY